MEQKMIDAHEPARPETTPAQRWLFLGVFGIGALFSFTLERSEPFWYGVFWLFAMAVFLAFTRPCLKKNRPAVAVGVPAALLCAVSMWSGLNESLRAWIMVAIPASMMLFAVLCVTDVPILREGVAFERVLRGFFVWPFQGIPSFFRAAGSLLRGERGALMRRIGLGVIVGLPLTAGVLTLLMFADDAMERFVESMFGSLSFGEWLPRAAYAFVAAMLFYALFYEMTAGRHKPVQAAIKNWNAAAPTVVTGMMLAVYAIFIVLQFRYLFSGSLPVDLTYSKYARDGFWQLILVSGINCAVLGLCFMKALPSKLMRAFETALIVASLLILASAAWRLALYVGAYGLTIRRVLPIWMTAYLAFLLIAALVKTYRARFPLLRIATYGFVYWYLALNLVDWNTLMQRVNTLYF